MSEPNPKKLQLKLLPEMVTKYKMYNCKFYEKCIDFAISKGWTQFQCTQCTAYEPEPNSPNLRELDEDDSDE